MRDEDLKNLPQSIEGWRIKELLDGIGIKHTDTRRIKIMPWHVEVEVYATDEAGRRIRETVDIDVQDLASAEPQTVRGFGDAKMHRITIPIDQVWDKPAEPAHDLCGYWKKLGGYRWECEIYAGHECDHDYTKRTGYIVGDSPQA